MVSPQRQLPLELLLAISTERTDDVRTLRAWSSVSSQFRDPCQQLLFRSITLELGEDNEPIYCRLRDIILSNSRIGSYVETLSLLLYDDREVAPSFAELVDLLPEIRKLTLDDGYGSSEGTWDQFSDSITEPILYLMSRPQLQSLCIGFVDIPLDLLSVLPQLKHLELTTNWGFRRELHFVSSSHPPPNRGYLETLSVRDTQECNLILRALHNPSSALSISRLTKFEGSICSDGEVPWFIRILDLASETLTSLSITLQIGE
ncbi:hypothetical protein C0995_002823 [Termitomyces sp. Mi166|nr:hypothetical protein C0995_002823 [Termitomyces sp. Mi166\